MDKKSILYILLAILAFSVFYRVATVPEEKRAPLKYKTGAKSSELGVLSSESKILLNYSKPLTNNSKL